MFTLLLAWNSIVCIHRFYPLFLWQCCRPIWRPSSWLWPWPDEDPCDALCDIVFHALLQDNSGYKREQCCGSSLDHPGDVYHPDLLYDKPAYFDVTVCNPLQDSILSQSAETAGVAASWGEVEKDAHHKEEVLGAGGSLFLWL